jgi:hypothetical protein
MKDRSQYHGLMRIELLAILAIGMVGFSVFLPVSNKLGCDSYRMQSMQNLQLQHKIHAMYATDWNERQFTAVPDDLGAYGGDCAAWEEANGTQIPGLVLGNSCGIGTIGFYGCEWSEAREPLANEHEFSTGLPLATFQKTAGAYRFPNNAALNQYANGRYHDPTFWAPDDIWSLTGAMEHFEGTCGYDAPSTDPVATSSYTMSPAAMWHENVFGPNDTWNDPRTFEDGYRSPPVTACVYPDLKTRLMEHYVVETCLPRHAWAGFHPTIDGSTAKTPAPCLFNQAPRGRSLALFFDGSARILTPMEVRHANNISEITNGTKIESGSYYESYSFGFTDEYASHHIHTVGGITGRDTITTFPSDGGTP